MIFLNVAICDDDEIFRSELKNILIDYKQKRRIHLDITEFSEGEPLLSWNYPFDIIFLDYQMPNIDGMETARILRARNCICSIIFITSFPEFVLESFEVNPHRFLEKPIDVTKITAAIDSYIEQNKMLSPIVVNVDGELKTISSKDIIYLEGDGKYCYVRTSCDTVHSSKTLLSIFNKLPQHCFYRVHKSFVVNLYCINSIEKNEVILNNGEKAKISRNNLSNFKKIYKHFVENYYLRL